MQLIIELPSRDELLARNRRRWSEILADRRLVNLPFKIETNAHGTLLMTPPPSGNHSHRQGRIVIELDRQLGGHVLPECPISTIDGVRAADVGWYSPQRYSRVAGQLAFETAPEICIEILSPGNVESEIREKRQLYFDAGADEFWLCDLEGRLSYFTAAAPDRAQDNSPRVPHFPAVIG